MLIIDGVRFKLWTPEDEEKEFHPMIKEHSKEIFGEDSLYFDVHHKLKYKLESRSGIASLPDAYAITLSKPYQWFVVENELSTHPVYRHVVPQLTKFINGIKNPRSQRQLANLLHEEIVSDQVKKAYVEKMIGSPEIYRFLSNTISKSPRIAIIVEQMTGEIREACDTFQNVQYVEFKTYVREDAENIRAHLFEPIYEHERPPEKVEKKGKKHPPYRIDWEKRLEWVGPSIRTLVNQLTERIERDLPNVTHGPHYRWYDFYRGKVKARKSRFAVLMITKKAVKVRIRTDPQMFEDEKGWTKSYKGWFFKKEVEEKGFKIVDTSEIEYAMKLIKQSYDMEK